MRATWLVDAIHGEGAPVQGYGDWSTTGADLADLRGIVVHHTASNPGSDPDGDLAYIWRNGSLVPEYNVYVSRSGMAYVGCAGKSNNAGKGGNTGDQNAGRVPVDWCPPNSANSYVLAVAGANDGVGEPWPTAQIDTIVKVCAAICTTGGVPVDHVISHWEWTSRKIDPAGSSPYATGAGMWDMDLYRANIWSELQLPLPGPKGDHKMLIVFQYVGQPDAWWVSDGVSYRRCWSFQSMDVIRLWQARLGYPEDMQQVHQLNADQLEAVGRPLPGEPAITV